DGLDGDIAVNEWLIRDGLLLLNDQQQTLTAVDKLNVDWSNTRVWSEGGYYARVFLNMQGRVPNGVISAAEYEAFQNEIKAKFEALTDDKGQALNSLVFKPKELYQNVRNVAHDLIVHFGALYWRSIGTIGHPAIHVQEIDTAP